MCGGGEGGGGVQLLCTATLAAEWKCWKLMLHFLTSSSLRARLMDVARHDAQYAGWPC